MCTLYWSRLRYLTDQFWIDVFINKQINKCFEHWNSSSYLSLMVHLLAFGSFQAHHPRLPLKAHHSATLGPLIIYAAQSLPTDEAAAYHVWLLGSQVSFPTLSMQNFWGPLLPAEVKKKKKNSVISSNVSLILFHHNCLRNGNTLMKLYCKYGYKS